jgi:S-adenosylmethionine decarboxylase
MSCTRASTFCIDCQEVAGGLCLNDKLVLNVMARATQRSGATLISKIRYKFESEFPPGFAAVAMLDESHCSANTYSDLGLIALDVFTCRETDPYEVVRYVMEERHLGDLTVTEVPRLRLP